MLGLHSLIQQQQLGDPVTESPESMVLVGGGGKGVYEYGNNFMAREMLYKALLQTVLTFGI